MIVLLQIFSWFWQWNNFENRLIFGKVKACKNGAIFGPLCIVDQCLSVWLDWKTAIIGGPCLYWSNEVKQNGLQAKRVSLSSQHWSAGEAYIIIISLIVFGVGISSSNRVLVCVIFFSELGLILGYTFWRSTPLTCCCPYLQRLEKQDNRYIQILNYWYDLNDMIWYYVISPFSSHWISTQCHCVQCVKLL